MNAHPNDFSMADELRDLTQAYRDATQHEEGQEPSPALDAAILAAAHCAVASKPQAVPPARRLPRFTHWRLPLAIAASVLIGVFVAMPFIQEETGADTLVLAQAPPSPQADKDAISKPSAPVAAEPPIQEELAVQEEAESFSLMPSPKPVQPLAERALMDERSESAFTKSRARRAENVGGVMRQTLTRHWNPRDWLEEIEKLRREGKTREARESLAEFRKHYPDHDLSEALRGLLGQD